MPNLAGSKLTFDDEFNKLSLDSGSGGTWQPAYSWSPNGMTDATMSSWMMNPAWGPTSAADANVYSNNNGVASIAFKPTPADVKQGDVGGKQFLSGQLTTKTSFSQLYGYFEANMKLPSAAGLNSAFWLLPADGSWPPELDVVELLGNSPTTMVMTAHSQASGSHTANPHWANIPDASQAFHTYGVDWQPDKLTWYFDGKQVAQENTPADMNKPMYMMLDTLSGTSGSWIGAPNPGETAQMDINYVRSYSSNPNAVGVTAQPGYVADNGAPSTPVAAPVSAPAIPAPPAAPATPPTVGSGVDTLVLKLSEDAYAGDAQFSVAVDGKLLSAAQSVTASHAQGQSQAFTFKGSFGTGPHTVGVSFLNDRWDGSAATDRNLYLDGATFNSSSAGAAAALAGNGTSSFTVNGSAASPAAPAPGTNTLRLSLAEDAWQGDALAVITVDGKAVGGTVAVTALHAQGASQAVTLTGSWGTGAHDVGVQFINDAYGGTPTMDRNLYVNVVSLDGQASAAPPATLYSNGTAHASIAAANPLVLHLSEDAWQGDAQFTVAVDGKTLGGAQSVTALHSKGAVQDFGFDQTMAAGTHDVAVSFLNDAYGGSAATDRNLYVNAIDANGSAIPGAAATLLGTATQHFSFVVAAHA
jgi:beta-glucanase (GH16 family)